MREVLKSTRPLFILSFFFFFPSDQVLCYANSGEAWDAQAKAWLPGTAAESWLQQTQAAVAAGASIVGGCCRVHPADIAELVRWVQHTNQ